MIIRVSERGTFKRCRKRWDYSSPNRQNLTTVGNPIALRFGSMVHKTLELWAEDPSQVSDDIFMRVSQEELQEIRARYKKAVGASPSEQELDEFYDHVELGRDMIRSYSAKWGSPVPDGYTLVQSEQTFHIQVPGTEHVLQGTFDGLMKNDQDELFILERKTYSSRPRIDNLQSNDQFLAYIWALSQLVEGAPVGGIFYDGLWKRKLEGKRTLDDLFLRELLIRPPEEVEQFEQYLVEEVQDMTDPNVRIYLNRQWQGCFDCPFERLCKAESRGEDVDYVRRSAYRTVESVTEEEEDNDFSSST